jgi:O-antigen/teichoic acid export membrane protein
LPFPDTVDKRHICLLGRQMSKIRNYNILRASGAGVLQRFAQLVISLITLPLALHTLGIAGFGVWGAATSLAWLSSLLTLGFGSALITLIPRGLASGQIETNRGYVTASLHGGAALSALLLLGWLAAVRLFGAPLPHAPFLVAGVALVLNIPLSIAVELWFALQKGHIAAFWGTVQTLLGLLFIILGAATGANVTYMVAAIYGAMLLANAGSLAHVLYLHHHIRPFRRIRPDALRAVLAQGGLLFAVTIAASCATAFDNVMALAWLGPAASAQMAVAMRVCITANGMVGAVTQPFWPSFADAIAANDHSWARRMLKAGTAAVLVLSVSGSALIIAFGEPVFRWWLHQDLHLPAPLLWAMGAWITGLALTNIPGSLLNAALKLKPQILILSITAIAGFGLKFLAARQFGVTGILVVTPILRFALVVPVYFWLAWQVVTRPE